MIHLLKDELGRYEAMVNDNPPGWRIDCGEKYPDEKSAVLAGIEAIIRHALYEMNCRSFEEYCQIAGVIGAEKANVLFEIIPRGESVGNLK